METKTKKSKFFWGAVVVVLLGLTFWAVWDRQRGSEEYQAQKYLDEMEELYMEDTYGGDTPEETLQLFIDALKNEDIDLAAKYFVLDKQDEWRGKLDVAKDNNNLALYIEEVQGMDDGKEIYDGAYLYTVVGENGMARYTISLVKNNLSDKWKIEDM